MSDENVSQVGQSGDTGTGAPAGQTASEPQAGVSAAGATVQPTATEDRKDWVPPHRLREVTEQRRQIEDAFRQAQAELNVVKRQVAALTGATPHTQDDPEIVAARQFLVQQFPALEKLSPEKVDRILQMADKLPDVTATTEHYWTSAGHATMQEVYRKAKDIFGGDLNEDQQDILHSAFVRFVERDGQNQRRYEFRDPSLVEDFFKKFSGAVVDPLRRKVTTNIAQTAERGRRLPKGGSGGAGVVVGQGKKTPKDAKEAAQMMHEIMQAG